jgi:Nif-specific regulatory protein
MSDTNQRLAALLDVSRAFNETIEIDRLLPLITAHLKELFHAESCAVLLLDAQRQELFFPVASDMNTEIEAQLRDLRFPISHGISGWVAREGKPILVPDVTVDDRFYPEVDRAIGIQTRGLMCAPLRARGSVIGVVGVRNKLDGTFTEADLDFLDAVAGPVAIAVDNARLYQDVRRSEARLQHEVTILHREREQKFTEIIGCGPAMLHVYALMESAITTGITVLLEGETGTGKELIARAIHSAGPRKTKPFVAMNCGAVSETLLESELFGCKRGAFTGAVADRPGLFEAADQGTVFLDEIGETTPNMQVKLLRALQAGEIYRVGDPRARKVDVRLISATNRELEAEVRAGRFREDLFYRINVFPIRVPPLRERSEDIPLLVASFLQRSNAKLGKHVSGVGEDALGLLTRYKWPGNVRELQNEIERAVALATDGNPLPVDRLSDKLHTAASIRVSLPTSASTLKTARTNFERQYVAEVLRQHEGNAVKAARALGISRQMLQKKIKEYRLRPR